MLFISAFPGTGKTTAVQLLEAQGFRVKDSDSSKHPKADFPDNYINEMLEVRAADAHDFVFVSSHAEVRAKMRERGIEFLLVYPSYVLKDAYIRRYVERGSSPEFVANMDQNWGSYLESCKDDQAPQYELTAAGEFLTDVINSIQNERAEFDLQSSAQEQQS